MWRYQPVFVVENGERVHFLREVQFSEDGALKSWSDADSVPSGNDSELSGVLCQMLVDALCWEPVELSSLRPGMPFVRLVSMDERRVVASFVKSAATAIREGKK